MQTSHQHLSDQEILRREKLQQLRDLGIEPYPAASYAVNAHAADVKNRFSDEEGENIFTDVTLAGRLMQVRSKGKACFGELQDSTGRIQIYVRQDDICPDEDKTLFTVFTKLLDIGDFVGVRGFAFRTRMGEITIHVTSFTVLAKTLRVLPVVKHSENAETGEIETHDGFTNPELRYRMRYVDLTVNPEFRDIFVKRSKLITTLRAFLDELGIMEVETPVLQNIHGGAAARPFKTQHNALDQEMFLRIANELYLKRLIVAGFDGVYELSKMFRNEGMDRTHNPEFTMCEFYVAYKDYYWMMETTEQLLERIAHALHGKTLVHTGGHDIEFAGPYRRLSMYDGIKEYTGVDISDMTEADLRAQCKTWDIPIAPSMGRGKIIDEIFGEKVEPHLVQPTFVTDHPEDMSPLTKKHREKAGLVERFELYVNGKEIANAYSELNDPIDQRERFEEQLGLAARGDDEAMALDEDFLRALEFGMPPTSGIGFGIDRLVMLFTNQASIQEVIFFPQMRPEKVD